MAESRGPLVPDHHNGRISHAAGKGTRSRQTMKTTPAGHLSLVELRRHRSPPATSKKRYNTEVDSDVAAPLRTITPAHLAGCADPTLGPEPLLPTPPYDERPFLCAPTPVFFSTSEHLVETADGNDFTHYVKCQAICSCISGILSHPLHFSLLSSRSPAPGAPLTLSVQRRPLPMQAIARANEPVDGTNENASYTLKTNHIHLFVLASLIIDAPPYLMPVTRSARTVSPNPSEASDMYWGSFDDRTSPSPAPSQNADAFGWDSDSTPVPMDSTNATPTSQMVRPSSPASVVEISKDEFPQLEAHTPATTAKPRAKATKDKGKKKAKAVAANITTPASDADDPFLAADIAQATAASLGLVSVSGNSTAGASSSRRPAAAPGSPSKRLRANTTGDAAPAPFLTATAIPAAPTTVPVAPAPVPIVVTPAPVPVSAAPAPALVQAPVQTAPVVTLATAPISVPTAISAHVTPPVVPAPVPAVAPAAPAVVPAAPAPAIAVAAVAAPAYAAVLAAPAPPVATAPALPRLWLTADGLPPCGSYTPTPAGGFPTIIYSPEQPLQGIPDDLIRM
ncbi:hypothetical protein C8R44DRAFT_873084 [Mycena epipterygia]|nr:hypothetical protein C8R44DRAFT_873084 [Mycena epipterygia]